MNSVQDIWNEILNILSQELTPTAMKTWFSACKPVEWTDLRLVLCVQNEFTKNILEKRFAAKIKEAMKELFSCDCELTILAGEDEFASYMETKTIASKTDILPEMQGFTFDRFIVGNSNRFAYAAAMAVAKNPGGRDYNPLFIYGNSGLGKTHLLFAIGQAIHESDPKKSLAYVKGEEFMNRMIDSVQSHKMKEFREEFRNVDLFLVDDIQFIAGKQQTQEEFFHTFNSLYEAGKQIVITSDRPPIEMSLLDDRLRTRFEGGVMADIQPPDLETRMVITREKAAQLGLMLSDEAVNYISSNITANIRQLEGVIKKLTAYKDILNEVITTDSVKRAIEDVIRIGDDIPKPEKIIRETARYYSISEEELRGQNRARLQTEGRQVAMYLMRKLTNLSLMEIGEQFENRNHTTVLSSIRKIEDMLKTDSSMAAKIRDISSNINSY
ncbi:MAG: chromosomal replication initiator protein DnaA [Oscillospiraceae bacterium]|nr:chromosomal replication initiator protein DnaA [Oscillospiraceae bacterium]